MYYKIWFFKRVVRLCRFFTRIVQNDRINTSRTYVIFQKYSKSKHGFFPFLHTTGLIVRSLDHDRLITEHCEKRVSLFMPGCIFKYGYPPKSDVFKGFSCLRFSYEKSNGPILHSDCRRREIAPQIRHADSTCVPWTLDAPVKNRPFDERQHKNKTTNPTTVLSHAVCTRFMHGFTDEHISRLEARLRGDI